MTAAASSTPFEQKQHWQEQSAEPRIYDVTQGLKSKHTKTTYRIAFNHFLDVTIKSQDRRALLNTKQNIIEEKIIDHITYLKDVEGLTYRSILVHLSAIFHFFEINDYDDLKRRKIKRFLPEDESDYYGKDRPYSIKEIEQILSKCDVRDKVAVLIMLSTGTRLGGLRELQIGDIKKIDEFGLYLIWVYNRSGRDRYYTFCTPECAAAIDEYLAYRKRIGEQLKDKYPLIRDKFSMDNYFKAPRFLSIRAMSLLFEEALKKAGVNQVKPGQKKREVMRSHGLRKYFITQCDKANINFTVREYLSGHKLPNQDASYIRTTEEDRCAEYVKAIPLLTIDSKQRLQTKVQQLEGQQTEEIERLKAQLGSYKEELTKAKQYQDASMLSIQELRARMNTTEDKYEKAILVSQQVQKLMVSEREKDKKRLEEMSPRMRKLWLDWEKTSEKKGESFTDYYIRKRRKAQTN